MLTHFVRGSITVHILLYLIGFSRFVMLKLSIDLLVWLVASKTVKQEISHTEILPLTK